MTTVAFSSSEVATRGISPAAGKGLDGLRRLTLARLDQQVTTGRQP